MENAVLPISLVLATLQDRYVAGLTNFRHASGPGTVEANSAINDWLRTFVDAAAIAAEQSEILGGRIEELRHVWDERVTAHRTAAGLRPAPRADSAVARLLRRLPEAPVVTATTLARILGVSFPAASSALDELEQADVLMTRSIERGAKAFIAREVLDLVTLSERTCEHAVRHSRHTPDPGSASSSATGIGDVAVTSQGEDDWPETAEALMRSRFEAFRDGDAAWLLASWHPSTRPVGLDLSDNPRWRGLQILDVVAGGVTDDRGVVEFRATYLVDGGGVDIMQERSEFVRENGRWYYLGAS